MFAIWRYTKAIRTYRSTMNIRYLLLHSSLLFLCLAACNGAGGRANVFNIYKGEEAVSSLNERRAGDTIRIASFNLYNRPISFKARLEKAALLLENMKPDIAALQEVAKGLIVGRDASLFLKNKLRYNTSVFWLEDYMPVFANGLAVISRLPVIESEGTVFNENRFFNRKGFIETSFSAPVGKLSVINVHLAATGRASIKTPQINQLIAKIKKSYQDEIYFLVGDFNNSPGDEPLEKLKKELGLVGLYEKLGVDVKSTCASRYGRSCAADDGTVVDFF